CRVTCAPRTTLSDGSGTLSTRVAMDCASVHWQSAASSTVAAVHRLHFRTRENGVVDLTLASSADAWGILRPSRSAVFLGALLALRRWALDTCPASARRRHCKAMG